MHTDGVCALLYRWKNKAFKIKFTFSVINNYFKKYNEKKLLMNTVADNVENPPCFIRRVFLSTIHKVL